MSGVLTRGTLGRRETGAHTGKKTVRRQRWGLEGCVDTSRTAGVGRQRHKLEKLGKTLSQSPEGAMTPRFRLPVPSCPMTHPCSQAAAPCALLLQRSETDTTAFTVGRVCKRPEASERYLGNLLSPTPTLLPIPSSSVCSVFLRC